jgi:DNA-directed RNA polymerase subunit alpha
LFDVKLPEITTDTADETYGRYRIEPLQPGWGTTLGASLRRILISSLVGAAVTGIRLSEMPDDPNDIPGIEEGLIDLVLNIKQLRFKVEEGATEGELRANLRADGKRGETLTAESLELPEGVEVVNPEVELVTLKGDGTPFEVEMLIETGRGYGSADMHVELPADMIPVDAAYTPVPRVNYVVEHTRVGQMTDYDRLMLEIWTDGSIHPEDALSQAAQILTQYATVVARYGRDIADFALDETAAPAEDDTNRPIEILMLSMRTTNALRRANITTIAQVLAMTDNDLMHLRNFGQKSLVELRDALAAHGYEIKTEDTGEEGEEAEEGEAEE